MTTAKQLKSYIYFSLVTMLLACMPLHANAASYEYTGFEAKIFVLINAARESVGAQPLVVDWEIARLARYKAEAMATHKLLNHESMTYGNPDQLLQRFGLTYDKLGATIAMGFDTPEGVVKAWLASEGNASSVLDADFTRLGVGLSIHDDIPYWAVLFVAD